MFDFNNFATATISDLKGFAAEHAIVPQGDRRRLDTWREAVQTWVESQAKPAIKAVVSSTKAAAAKAREVATSPKAIENYTRILSVARYLGEQIAVGCEYGLRGAVWGLTYAVAFVVLLVKRSAAEAAWSPIDRADVPVKELPSSEMLERLPAHGPAVAFTEVDRKAASIKAIWEGWETPELRAEKIHEAAVELNEAIASTNAAMAKLQERARKNRSKGRK